MTFTITVRRAALVLLTVLALTVVYVIGAARSGGAPASASTPTGSAGTSSQTSANLSSTQTSTTATIAGAGIIVGARASVTGTPDTLRLDLSVVATAPSVSEALASANRSAGAVQKSLLGNGVQKSDLQTSGLEIQPNYDYSSVGTPRLRGYQVSESVSAKLRNLGSAGNAIGKAVSAGGNAVRVNGISVDLEDTGALVSAARDKAFAEAKAKAEQYAKAAGRSLGNAVSIAEGVATPPPSPIADKAVLAASASVPIQPGSQDVSVSVTVVFSIR